jgi:hypothetical protein
MQQTKKPVKIYELINWLLGQEDKLPEHFIEQKSKLGSLVPYITEQLWTNMNLVHYLNKHTNDLFNIPDPIEQLKLVKKIITIQGIPKYKLWNFFPTRGPDLVKEIEERENYDEGNARSKLLMLKAKETKDDIVKKYHKKRETKTSLKQSTTPEDKALVKNAITNEAKKELKKLNKANLFLDNLSQETIDELGLVLFDVSLLKKSNQVLFSFIDKNNQKRYWKEPFAATVYISKKNGVINNDYIEEITDDFIHNKITDIKIFNRIKYAINDSYKRTVNAN